MTAWKIRIRSSAHGLATTLSQQTAHTVCRLANHPFLVDHNVAVSWRDWVRELACEVLVVEEPQLPPPPAPSHQEPSQSLFTRAVEQVRDAGLQKWSSQQPVLEEEESTAITTTPTLPPFEFDELLSTHSASARVRVWLVQILRPPQPPTITLPTPTPLPPQFVSIDHLTRNIDFEIISYLLHSSMHSTTITATWSAFMIRAN
jgi:hypothetical protein